MTEALDEQISEFDSLYKDRSDKLNALQIVIIYKKSKIIKYIRLFYVGKPTYIKKTPFDSLFLIFQFVIIFQQGTWRLNFVQFMTNKFHQSSDV